MRRCWGCHTEQAIQSTAQSLAPTQPPGEAGCRLPWPQIPASPLEEARGSLWMRPWRRSRRAGPAVHWWRTGICVQCGDRSGRTLEEAEEEAWGAPELPPVTVRVPVAEPVAGE